MTQDEAEALAKRVKSQDSRVQAVVSKWRPGNYHLDLTLKRRQEGTIEMRVRNTEECESVLQAWRLL